MPSRCECGNDSFICTQRVLIQVEVNGFGKVSRNDHDFLALDKPQGPFECTKCGKEYEDLPISEIKFENHKSWTESD